MGTTIEKCRTCKYAFTTVKDRWYCKKSLADKDDCGEYDMDIKALEQEPCDDAVSRQKVLDLLEDTNNGWVINEVLQLPSVNPQEPKTGWNNHQIACMLADLFGDACACNYNGIDEWLSELCDFKDTCCPNPVGVACWEQFLKYSQSRYTECGYEVRDKNALQEPKTGHWIEKEGFDGDVYYDCSECGESWATIEGTPWDNEWNYCPNCGARMFEP